MLTSRARTGIYYSAINDWWRRQCPNPAAAPARLTYQAGALPFGAKIEFQAIAATASDPGSHQMPAAQQGPGTLQADH